MANRLRRLTQAAKNSRRPPSVTIHDVASGARLELPVAVALRARVGNIDITDQLAATRPHDSMIDVDVAAALDTLPSNPRVGTSSARWIPARSAS